MSFPQADLELDFVQRFFDRANGGNTFDFSAIWPDSNTKSINLTNQKNHTCLLGLYKIQQTHQGNDKKFITLIPIHWGGDTKASSSFGREEDLSLLPSTAISDRSDGLFSCSPDSLTNGEGLTFFETCFITNKNLRIKIKKKLQTHLRGIREFGFGLHKNLGSFFCVGRRWWRRRERTFGRRGTASSFNHDDGFWGKRVTEIEMRNVFESRQTKNYWNWSRLCCVSLLLYGNGRMG